MSRAALARQCRQRRSALYALFAGPGFAISSWVARTPDIRDSVRATTTEMGLILFGVSCGAMLGIAASAPLVARFGARRIATTGMTGVVVSMPVVGSGSGLGRAAIVALGLFLFGFGMGLAEIAANVEAASLERESGTSVLRPMHGYFSLGTALGALVGVCCILAHVPVRTHLVLVGIAIAPLLFQTRRLSPHTGRRAIVTSTDDVKATKRRFGQDRRLLLIGVIVFAMALAEGAATDWLPLVMVDGHGESVAMGSAVFAAFAGSMAVGRFSGGYLLSRFGPALVLRLSATAAVVGIGCIALLDNRSVGAVAVVLWGLGLSLGVPVAISAAADSGAGSAARVAFVSNMGYLALLVGPPALGAIGGEVGLRLALLVPGGLVVVAIFLAPALAPRGSVRHASIIAAGEAVP